MTSEEVSDNLTKRSSCLVQAGSFPCEARCCCVVDDVVWVAELKGGVSLYDSHNGSFVGRVVIGETGDQLPHIKCMALVHSEVWAADNNGKVYIFHSPQRKWKRQLTILGVEASAPISSLYFDGKSVLAASETGRVVQWNPFTKRQIGFFVALSPLLAVTVTAGLIIGGDREGAVYCWDPITGAVVKEHTHDTTAVSSLLGEPVTGNLWVGRKNGSISVYSFLADSENGNNANNPTALRFDARLKVGDGAVTSMVSVSGKVVATSYDRSIVVFHATTRELITRTAAAHGAFIYGISRIHCAETVRAWSLGNDGNVRMWDIAGFYVPAQAVPALSPFQQAAMVENVKGSLSVENAQLASSAAASRGRVVDVREELRLVKEELHELRLLKGASEEVLRAKDAKISERDGRVKELEKDVKTLNKEVAENNARADTVQKELALLRTQLLQSQQSVTEANTQLSSSIAKKAEVEQRLSAQCTERSHLEIRLRDRDAEVAQLKAEHLRMQNMLYQSALADGGNRNMYTKALDSTAAALRSQRDELQKKLQFITAMLVSMEYTIRRKEEEERDMTALLNAFRRKLTGSVTDPHLFALLNATMLRNPNRFELECDEETKALLRDRNGPFIRFLNKLRNYDLDTYEQLVKYLQHPEAGSQFSSVFDKLLSLAQKESGTNEGDIVSFKRDLPVLLGSLTAHRASLSPTMNSTTQAPTTRLSPVANTASSGDTETRVETKPKLAETSSGLSKTWNTFMPVGTSATAQAAEVLKPVRAEETFQPSASGVVNEDKRDLPNDKQIAAFLKGSGLTTGDELNPAAIMSCVSGDDSYLKKIRSTFEFILQTRGELVEKLASLLKRVVKARQFVDALASNTREGFPSQRRMSASLNGASGSRQGIVSVVTSVLEDIHRLAAGITTTYLTESERQRYGVTS